MGMYDELFCDADLPDSAVPPATCFRTKAFPAPFLFRYRITKAGQLIDARGRDLECRGYLEFHCYLDDSPDKFALAKYRAHFCDGQLKNIVRVNKERKNARVRVFYGLASYRVFALSAPSGFDSETVQDEKGAGHNAAAIEGSPELTVPDRDRQSWSSTAPKVYSDHQRLDARSLALHCLVARKLLANPALITRARCTLARWRARATEPVPSHFLEWGRVLEGSPEEIAAFLASVHEDATRLRQSSPFSKLVTPEERARIYAAFR
jgi:hypothetical protein